MPGKIAYIMSRFPHLPETFILREMIALRQLGWDVHLFPLIIQKQKVIHAEAQEWVERAHRIPLVSLLSFWFLFREFIQNPTGFFQILIKIIRENRSSIKFLIRAVIIVPKAVYIAHLMRRERIEYIHAHYATHPALAAWIIHQITGIPYSFTAHAHDIFVDRAMLASKIKDAAFVAAISEFNRTFLAEKIGDWVRSKIEVVHCGIQPQYYISRTNPRNPDESLQIVSIGSLQPYKGQKHLIASCAILKERGIPFRCQIIGGGELKDEINNQIAGLGLKDCVSLTGPLPQHEVASRLAGAHCYVQPSVITPSGKMEGIPVALMEALASGVPVVATRISGIPELVKDGHTGWLVEPEDSTALADAIERVYRNPQLAHQLAQRGRLLVETEYNQETSARRLADLFYRHLSISRDGKFVPTGDMNPSETMGRISPIG